MPKPKKDQDQAKGDEILRRLLKTAPDPKAGRKAKAANGTQKPKSSRSRDHANR